MKLLGIKSSLRKWAIAILTAYITIKKTTKHIKNEKTFTIIERINEEKKVEEIAKMLGGVKLTENTLTNAREIIELANKKKNIIMENHT